MYFLSHIERVLCKAVHSVLPILASAPSNLSYYIFFQLGRISFLSNILSFLYLCLSSASASQMWSDMCEFIPVLLLCVLMLTLVWLCQSDARTGLISPAGWQWRAKCLCQSWEDQLGHSCAQNLLNWLENLISMKVFAYVSICQLWS